MLRNRGCLLGLGLLLVAPVVGYTLLDLYTEWAWFDALGFTSLLWRRLLAEWLLFLVAWLVAGAILAANWLLARSRGGGSQMSVPWLQQQRYRSQVYAAPTTRILPARTADLALLVLAVVFGFLIALPARASWLTALKGLNATAFGQVDPILGRDIGFYIFRLPWLEFLQGWFLWVIIVALAGTALVYVASYSAQRLNAQVEIVGARGPWLRLPPGADRHLLVLGAVALALLAWGYQLDIPHLLYSSAGAAYGAGYADVQVRLPALNLLTVIVAAGALVLLASVVVRVRWLPYAVVAAWLLTAFLGTSAIPGLIQRAVVIPNELAREREYIAHSISLTRAAYGFDDALSAEYDVATEAVPFDIAAEQATISNVRLWDYRPLLRTYSQLQEIRLYYTFSDVDVDRYRLADDYRQVTLAVRELASDDLPDTAQTWVNRHLVYTHGVGAVVSPVNEAVEEGLPDLWLRDIPPQARYPELALSRYEIYYGELTDDYVVVNTDVEELDYPAGDENVYTRFEGSGGVVLNSPLKRVAYALRLGSNQFLLSTAINADSQLLWRRAIDTRVRTLAPFLRYDPDPYAVILDGRLVWIMDAYTVSNRYPYSDPIDSSYGRLNYIRNSVKITVDAYDGTVTFYLVDPADPIAATYAAIFPDLFRPVADMPQGLVDHWRYPEGLFGIQASKLQTFHMTDPQVFYNQEDLWNWPEEVTFGEQTRVEPYYVIMKLPSETEAEFVLMLPFTPSNRQNMIAWLYARNDGDAYGELGIYNFPKQRLVYGPMQVESRINQDALISQQLTLWNQQGSRVIRGNLLVIPIDGSILYVEPLYLQAETSQLPELRRVIVAYGNRIAMEETLAAGLARVMGTAPPAEGSQAGGAGEPTGEEVMPAPTALPPTWQSWCARQMATTRRRRTACRRATGGATGHKWRPWNKRWRPWWPPPSSEAYLNWRGDKHDRGSRSSQGPGV
jgi:uncharacterized protein